MIHLVDTSVWVEFFRRTQSPADRALTELIRAGTASLLGCPPVRMELSLDSNELRRRRVLNVYDGFPDAGAHPEDYEVAADVFRATRATGHTPRSLVDCLVAATALRTGATVVHHDADFDRMAAAVSTLSVLPLPPG